MLAFFFFFQAEDGIRDADVTGVQTCALPISFLSNTNMPLGLGPQRSTLVPSFCTSADVTNIQVPTSCSLSDFCWAMAWLGSKASPNAEIIRTLRRFMAFLLLVFGTFVGDLAGEGLESPTRHLHGLARSRGSGDFFQPASFYIENVSVDRNGPGNQRVVANAPHVGDDGSGIIFHREPINELALRRSGAFPDIAKAAGRELCRLEATGKKIPHHLVREEQHAAVGVVNDEELIRAKQLVGDDQGAERVVARAPSGIANDVSISLRESGVLGRIQTGVHARENRKVPRRWYRQLALRAKRRSVARIRLQNFW